MTDIVEQAARVLFIEISPISTHDAEDAAQALADAGLLVDLSEIKVHETVNPDAPYNYEVRDIGGNRPRTVPTREEVETAIGGVLFKASNHPDPVTVLGKDVGPLRDKVTDAVLALMNDQPTVAESKAQALEEAAIDYRCELGENPANPGPGHAKTWLHTRAQQIRDGQHRPAAGPRPATPEMRVEWRSKPPLTKSDETHIEARATCRKCGTVTRVGMIARHGARPEFPQSLLKCDCQQIRDEK